mgnify:CR=1 FL=1
MKAIREEMSALGLKLGKAQSASKVFKDLEAARLILDREAPRLLLPKGIIIRKRKARQNGISLWSPSQRWKRP